MIKIGIVGDIGTGKSFVARQFNCPVSVVEDPYGYVFVVDTLNQRIQKFDPNLNFISKWGIVGKDPGQLYNPSGICLSWEPDWAPQEE